MLSNEVLEYFRNSNKSSILYGKLSDNLDFLGTDRWIKLKNYIVKLDRVELINKPNYCRFYVHDKNGSYNFLAYLDSWTKVGDILLVPAGFITYPNGDVYMQTPVGYTKLNNVDESNLSKLDFIVDDNINILTKHTYYINERCMCEAVS